MQVMLVPIVGWAVPLPKGAKILGVEPPGLDGAPLLCVLGDPERAKESREIYVFEAGDAVPDLPLDFIGSTYSPADGSARFFFVPAVEPEYNYERGGAAGGAA